MGRRVLVAGTIGNITEWYDFGIYGYLATTIASHFFPIQVDRSLSILATLAIFGVSFLARPLGGLVFGSLGDRLGRRTVLAIIVSAMGATTMLIGFLPTYAAAGILAPLLLTLLRLVQGFCAGGEYTGAAALLAEYAPPARRGTWASSTSGTSLLGFALGALIVYLLSAALPAETFQSWGWRIPFLIAGPLALVGLYLRWRIEDPPAFRRLEQATTVRRAPVRQALHSYPRLLIIIFVIAAANCSGIYMLVGYLPTYMLVTLQLSQGLTLFASVSALVLGTVLVLFFGSVSDRVGRRPVLLGGCAGLVILSVPGYLVLAVGTVPTVVLGLVVLVIPWAAVSAAMTIMAVESLPTSVRYSGSSVAYNSAQALFGGTAALVGAALVAITGQSLAPAYYATAVPLVALVLLISLRVPETFHNRMDDGPPVPEHTENVELDRSL